MTDYVAFSIIVGYLVVQAGATVTDSVDVAHVSDLAVGHDRRLAMSVYQLAGNTGCMDADGVAALAIWQPAVWIIVIAATTAGIVTVIAQPRLTITAAATDIPASGTPLEPVEPAICGADPDEAIDKREGLPPRVQYADNEPVVKWIVASAVAPFFLTYDFWPVLAAGAIAHHYLYIIAGQSIGGILGNIILSCMHTSFRHTMIVGAIGILVMSPLPQAPSCSGSSPKFMGCRMQRS